MYHLVSMVSIAGVIFFSIITGGGGGLVLGAYWCQKPRWVLTMSFLRFILVCIVDTVASMMSNINPNDETSLAFVSLFFLIAGGLGGFFYSESMGQARRWGDRHI